MLTRSYTRLETQANLSCAKAHQAGTNFSYPNAIAHPPALKPAVPEVTLIFLSLPINGQRGILIRLNVS